MSNRITQIITEAADLVGLEPLTQSKVDYVVGQFLFENRSESDMSMLVDTITPIVRGRVR